MSREQDVIRASRAKQLLDDPMIQEAFAEVEKKMTEAWRKSPITDVEARERCFRVLVGLDAFKAFFEIAIQNGVVAEYQVSEFRRTGMKPAA